MVLVGKLELGYGFRKKGTLRSSQKRFPNSTLMQVAYCANPVWDMSLLGIGAITISHLPFLRNPLYRRINTSHNSCASLTPDQILTTMWIPIALPTSGVKRNYAGLLKGLHHNGVEYITRTCREHIHLYHKPLFPLPISVF